jgi:hypothetical protein
MLATEKTDGAGYVESSYHNVSLKSHVTQKLWNVDADSIPNQSYAVLSNRSNPSEFLRVTSPPLLPSHPPSHRP